MADRLGLWLQAFANGDAQTNVNLPPLRISIPPNGRLVRLVLMPKITGVSSGTGGVETVGPIWYLFTCEVQDLFFPARTIQEGRRAVPFSATGFQDTTAPAGNNRVYTIYSNGGDRELGFNLQTSYGGKGQGGFTVELRHLAFRGLSSQVNSIYTYDIVMKALYYDNT